MSAENVELARRAVLAAFAQPPDMAAIRDLAGPEVVITTNWGADETVHRGLPGFLDAMAEAAEAWHPWRQDLERLVDAGPDSVVALMRLTARGRESGVPVEFRWAMVFTLSDGKIAAARAFIDQEEALSVARLNE